MNVDNINSYEAVFPSGNKCFMTKEPHENATVNLNRMNALTSCQESKNTECSANLRNTNAEYVVLNCFINYLQNFWKE